MSDVRYRFPHRMVTFDGTFTDVEETAGELLWRAMDERVPVTVGFYEHRKDERNRPMYAEDEHGMRVPLYVHAVRTFELYEVAENEDNGQLVFRGMDRCPADRSDPANVKWGKPGIRRVVAGRVTDITVHARQSYRYPNAYFLGKVREHAREQASPHWQRIADLTRDALWEVIKLADSTESAIHRAAMARL